MNRRFKEHRIKYRGIEYRVLVPIIDFSELYVCEVDVKGYVVFGDRASLEELAYHIMCIKNNPEYILYIPSKKYNTDYLKSRWMCEKSYDLVLMHHSIQLKYKVWKDLRKILRKPEIIRLLSPPVEEPNYASYSYLENKDVLLAESRFDTLFLTGSGLVIDLMADYCNSVAEWGEESFSNHGCHAHAHLDLCLPYKVRRNRSVDVTIDFYSKELWGY